MGGARRGSCGWFERVSSLFSFKERTARSPDEFRGAGGGTVLVCTVGGRTRHRGGCRMRRQWRMAGWCRCGLGDATGGGVGCGAGGG